MAMTKKQLEEYCEKHSIFVPAKAPKEYLEAAIVRAARHQREVSAQTCFGLWEKDDSACLTCDHEAVCFQVSIGMSKQEYFSAVERSENPKFRFAQSMRRK